MYDQAVPSLRQLAASLLLWWYRFDPRTIHVRFVVDKVALRFSSQYFGFLLQCPSTSAPYSVIYQSLMLYKISKLQHQTTYLESKTVQKLTLCSCPGWSSAVLALCLNTTFYHPTCCKECRTVWSPCAWLPLKKKINK